MHLQSQHAFELFIWDAGREYFKTDSHYILDSFRIHVGFLY